MTRIPDWFKISLMLSVFGFLKEIRPSEPFIYEFLIDKTWRNVSESDVTQNVYPVGTYSYLAHLVVVFLVTDLCRYKPLIILLSTSGIVIWSMLLWTKSLLALQILEVFYGTFSATEVAYYTYIYAKVDTEYFQQVTSHTRAAILAGGTISGIVGQLLSSFDILNYRQLNYITLSAMILATVWACFLPNVDTSIYFHQEGSDKYPLIKKFHNAFSLMMSHFSKSFRNTYVLKWSLWYALSMCGFIQTITYIQPLWAQIVKDTDTKQDIYNGAVHSVSTVIGFQGTLLAGFLKADWKIKGDLSLTICSLLQGFLLLYCSRTDSLMFCYIAYIANNGIFYFMVTVASSEVARYIREVSYGLVFGVNTFMALVFQTVLTAVVVTQGVGLALNSRDQYFVYGCYHVIIAVIFIVIGMASWAHRSKDFRKRSSIVQ